MVSNTGFWIQFIDLFCIFYKIIKREQKFDVINICLRWLINFQFFRMGWWYENLSSNKPPKLWRQFWLWRLNFFFTLNLSSGIYEDWSFDQFFSITTYAFNFFCWIAYLGFWSLIIISLKMRNCIHNKTSFFFI